MIFGQEINQNILDSLFIKSLNNRFDLLISSGFHVIEPTQQTERIKNNFKNTVFWFMNQNEIFDYAYKHGKKLELLRITHKQISADTIDINFSEIKLTVRKGIYFKGGLHFRKANITIGCGGTNGYIPDFRFVYNKEEDRWIIFGGNYKWTERK